MQVDSSQDRSANSGHAEGAQAVGAPSVSAPGIYRANAAETRRADRAQIGVCMRISQATLNRRRKRGLYQDDISPRRVHVTIAIPEWLYDGLVAIANSERPRYTVSRVAAEALEDYFSDGGGFFTKS